MNLYYYSWFLSYIKNCFLRDDYFKLILLTFKYNDINTCNYHIKPKQIDLNGPIKMSDSYTSAEFMYILIIRFRGDEISLQDGSALEESVVAGGRSRSVFTGPL